MRVLVACAFFVVLGALPAHAVAGDVAPLEVDVTGEGQLRVRVSAGVTTPCDSSDDAPIASEIVDANKPFVVKTNAVCVCIDHTYAPFTEAGWSPSTVYCRPCFPAGKRRCVTDMAAPWRVVVSAKE